MEIQLVKVGSSRNERSSCFLHELGENNVVDYHEQNICTISNDTGYVVFDNLVFRHTVLSGAIEQSF